MIILITNDDGYSAEGIKVMKKHLEGAGHTVYMIAPHANRSAVSHHINMKEPQEIKEVGDCEWSCTGLPVDCVAVGVRSDFLPNKPDCIISGINYGANAGSDIVYSGTCAAARQGSMYGIPSIAVSLEHEKGFKATAQDFEFDEIAAFVTRNLDKLVSICDTKFPYTFVNINGFSGCQAKEWVAVEELAERQYHDWVSVDDEEDGTKKSHFHMGGSLTNGGEKSDYAISKSRKIAVCKIVSEPVCVDLPSDLELD